MTTAAVLKHPSHNQHFADAMQVASALKPEEPVFLFSATELKSRAKQFINNFPGQVTYAVKCNPPLR
jgi:ornithine decarboxylase